MLFHWPCLLEYHTYHADNNVCVSILLTCQNGNNFFARKQRQFLKIADNTTKGSFIQEIVKQDSPRWTKLYIVRALLHKQTRRNSKKNDILKNMLEPENFKKTKTGKFQTTKINQTPSLVVLLS